MMGGIFLAALDQTIVLSSYVAIGSDLEHLEKTSWIVTGYMLTLASFQWAMRFHSPSCHLIRNNGQAIVRKNERHFRAESLSAFRLHRVRVGIFVVRAGTFHG